MNPVSAKRQCGATLMALLAVLVLGSSWMLVSTPVNRKASEVARNAKVLSEAKQALLGYVVALAANSSEDFPGRLPCPEPGAHVANVNYEGIAAPYVPSAVTTCTNIGRLPWRTLGIDKLRDAAGEPLWYMVTTGANEWAKQISTTTLSINSNKLGGLAVNAQLNAAVAVIIAPGNPFNVSPNANQVAAGCAARVQNRSTTPPDYRDYIECHNIGASSALTGVVDNASNQVFNDQVVVVTAAEVMAAIEGVVAARILQSVVPQLQSVYDSAEWGASSAAPIFPFPARFRNDAATTFNPETYQGHRYSNDANTTTTLTQGLLPMTADTCNAITSGRCDPMFVAFITATISAVQTGGNATTFNANCSTSTTTQIRCVVNYSRLICFFSCPISAIVRVNGTAVNVGMTLKTLNTGLASGLTSLTAPLQTNGSALTTYTGTLQGNGTGGFLGLCGFLIGIACSGSATIIVPIGVFQQHALVNPATTDSWYWFVINKWYEVTYYAVAPSHLPSGATHNCVTQTDCLAVTGGNPASNLRAIVILAGRSLSNTPRPNESLLDFLDAQNLDGNSTFVQNKVGRTYNDRVVAISY